MSKIAVFDSGCGGITTLSAIRNLLPHEDYIYIADKSAMGYGDKSEEYIMQRILYIHDLVIKTKNIKAWVMACNTATSVAIDTLRKSPNNIIYLGLEPAIKPAINELTFGKVLVLLTPLTAQHQRFLKLADNFDCYKNRMIIAPMQGLAAMVEKTMYNIAFDKNALYAFLKPYFDEPIESVVLGCTHYCLIKDCISEFFNAKIYDGNVGAAIRLYKILKQKNIISRAGGSIEFLRL